MKREGSILPLGLDVSDLMLAGVLLLLFMDSHDEDFLVILLVMMSSILMPDKK